MISFVFDIGETPRKVARAIGHVRSELQKAFVVEKIARKLTQQAIATKRGVHRSVINRQLTGVDDLTYRSIVENALAMGYEPDFSLHRIEQSFDLFQRIKPEPEAERVIVIMSSELIAKIEAYRRSGDRIPSRSEAVRELIEAGVVARMGRSK